MSQRLTQIQTQKTEQQLRLSQQQLQLVRLLEMPIAEFEQQVKKELMDNPALEEGAPEEKNSVDEPAEEMESNDTGIDPYGDMDNDRIADLSTYSDDDLPVYTPSGGGAERNDLPLGDSGSFIEYLESQMMNYDLSEDEEKILKYLIGSLDNRGFIDRPIATLTDELAFRLEGKQACIIITLTCMRRSTRYWCPFYTGMFVIAD